MSDIRALSSGRETGAISQFATADELFSGNDIANSNDRDLKAVNYGRDNFDDIADELEGIKPQWAPYDPNVAWDYFGNGSWGWSQEALSRHLNSPGKK